MSINPIELQFNYPAIEISATTFFLPVPITVAAPAVYAPPPFRKRRTSIGVGALLYWIVISIKLNGTHDLSPDDQWPFGMVRQGYR